MIGGKASIGYPPSSILETLWQQDTYLWHPEIGHLAAEGVSFGDGEDGDAEGDEGKKMRELAMVCSWTWYLADGR
jgi:hypothetical protein